MASRRIFGYDPYDYYYTAPPSNYPYNPYNYPRQPPSQPAAARSVGGFFPAADPAAVPSRRRSAPDVEAVNPNPRPRTVSIPVQFVGSDPDPKPAAAAPMRTVSAEEAAVRVQAAARGWMARKAVRALRAVEREAEQIGEKVAREAAALRGNARKRIAIGEELMRLLLRIDGVRGARDYRRRVAKRVLALQDAVDALEPRPEPAEEPESAVTVAAADEVATERPPDAAERRCETESKAAAEMEVDGDRAADKPCATADETEQAAEGKSDAEREWEMVAEEPEPATEPPRQEPTVKEEEVRKADEEATANGVVDNGGQLDEKKLMEMVAALCERSAQQCAVIGALADRVDALERTVRRVEDAERRRRRAKKLKKEGKGSNQNKSYIGV